MCLYQNLYSDCACLCVYICMYVCVCGGGVFRCVLGSCPPLILHISLYLTYKMIDINKLTFQLFNALCTVRVRALLLHVLYISNNTHSENSTMYKLRANISITFILAICCIINVIEEAVRLHRPITRIMCWWVILYNMNLYNKLTQFQPAVVRDDHCTTILLC